MSVTSEISQAKEKEYNSKKKFDYNLEALRGIAALAVVWGHLIYYKIDPFFVPTGVFSFVAPGHLCVLLFFILSGYVIGLSNRNSIQKGKISAYLSKRFTRLYPIYIICFALALLVARQYYSLDVIVSHIFMTYGLTSPIIMEINPAWSLGYEIIFYFLFIPISYYKVNTIYVFIGSFFIGLLAVYFNPFWFSLAVSSYSFGFMFWIAGLIMAERLRTYSSMPSYVKMLAMIFLLMSLYQLDIVPTILDKSLSFIFNKSLNLKGPYGSPNIVFRDLGFMPYCVFVMLVFIGKESVINKWLTWILLLFPGCTIAILYSKSAPLNEQNTVAIYLYIVAIVIFIASQFNKVHNRVRDKWLRVLSPIGGISYALYLVHFPVLWVFMHWTLFSGSAVSFTTRSIAFLLLCLSISYLLERKFQPRIKKLLSPKD